MAYTEITSEGWLSRLGKSIGGVLVGILFVVVAFPVLFWNEGRAVQTAKSLEEGAAAVIDVDPASVSPSNDRRLVHVSGTATTNETLNDSVFGVSINALRLQRETEKYQWEETKRSETRKKLGGGTETITTYDYHPTWASHLIDSSGFREAGHNNPSSWRYAPQSSTAQHATLGAYVLDPSQVAELGSGEVLSVDSPRLPTGVHLNSGVLYVGESAGAEPKIGDERITFKALKPTTASVIGEQVGSSLRPYQTKAGDKILIVSAGQHSADEMFKQEQLGNTAMTWVLRFVGWLVMFIGFGMVFKPLSVLADVIPFLGSMVGAGTGLFAFVIASSLSTVTCAIAWIFYRPIVGVPLLLLAGGGIYWLATHGKKKQAARVQPAL